MDPKHSYRVLVCGGRDYRDFAAVNRELSKVHAEKTITCVVQGGAAGTDGFARQWALEHGIRCETYAAEWTRLGNRAGTIRNQEMIDEGRPDAAVAFPGGSGTADMVARLARAKIPTRFVRAKKETAVAYQVYLAGGFHGELRTDILAALNTAGLHVFDPKEHGQQSPEEYADTDTSALRRSAVVLAFMDDTNPSGYGLSAEIGFAHALSIAVVFIDRLSRSDPRWHYFDFVRPMCRMTTTDIEVAVRETALVASREQQRWPGYDY